MSVKRCAYTLVEDQCLLQAMQALPKEATFRQIHANFCTRIQVNTNNRTAVTLRARAQKLRKADRPSIIQRIEELRKLGLNPQTILEKRSTYVKRNETAFTWKDSETKHLLHLLLADPKPTLTAVTTEMQRINPEITRKLIRSKVIHLKRSGELPEDFNLSGKRPVMGAHAKVQRIPSEIQTLALEILRELPTIDVPLFTARIRLLPQSAHLTDSQIKQYMHRLLKNNPELKKQRLAEVHYDARSAGADAFTEQALKIFRENPQVTPHHLTKSLFGRVLKDPVSRATAVLKSHPDVLRQLKKNKNPRLRWTLAKVQTLLKYRSNLLNAAEELDITFGACERKLKSLRKQANAIAARLTAPPSWNTEDLLELVSNIKTLENHGVDCDDPEMIEPYNHIKNDVSIYSWAHWTQDQVDALKSLLPLSEGLTGIDPEPIGKPPYECCIAYLKYVSGIDFPED